MLGGVRRAGVVLPLVITAWVGAGCGGGDEGVACTAEVRPSVDLIVTNSAGARLDGLTVRWRMDGGAERSRSCNATDACTLGEEQPGRYDITVTRAGFAAASTAVTVTADECHVITQRLTLVLQPAS